MSTSTNAYLFYGYTWDEEGYLFVCDDPDADPDDDWDGWWHYVARHRGLVNPRDAYMCPDDLRYTSRECEHYEVWLLANKAAIDAYDLATEAITAEAKGVYTSTHGALDYLIPYVFTKQHTARCGCPTSIAPEMLTVDPAWAEQLDRWFAVVELEKPHAEPGWFLVSNRS